jgi:hypothetical protein
MSGLAIWWASAFSSCIFDRTLARIPLSLLNWGKSTGIPFEIDIAGCGVF